MFAISVERKRSAPEIIEILDVHEVSVRSEKLKLFTVLIARDDAEDLMSFAEPEILDSAEVTRILMKSRFNRCMDTP